MEAIPEITVEASPSTVHWGYFSADLQPVARIDSGDSITLGTVSGYGESLPADPSLIPEGLRAINNSDIKRIQPGHICTGPIAIRGIKKGEVLQVDIQEISLAFDWGYTSIQPLRGALPDDFEHRKIFHSQIDRERKIATLPWGVEIPLDPFFGIIACAPPPEWGTISTLPPRRNGGNIDNKELVAGTTLYLPVFVDEGLFSVGDGHAVQGDGEVCLSACETGLNGRFKLTRRADMSLQWPLAETPTSFITMGFDPDLDECVKIAVRQMISLITEKTSMDRYQAYTLCSLVGDLRISQVVNGSKGVHFVVPKSYFTVP